jgi:uncharacterized protein YukE
MAGTGGGQQQPEQKTVLGFPVRPAGDAEAVVAGRHYWYELAGEISGAFAEIDRAISGMQWSGEARSAFNAAWSQFSGHGTEATQHAQEMGDQLLKLGNRIEEAQHEWDVAMAAMAASTAIGIGLTFVTFGVSDAVAEGAATAAVGTMEAVCAALDVSLDAAMQVLIAAIRVAVQLAVKFTWQFAINVVSQETANVVEGRGLGNVDLLQAAEFAGVSMVIPGVAGKLTIGGREVLSGFSGAVLTGAATDAAVQGLEGVTEGKPFSLGEVLLSGALAGGGHALGEGVSARFGGVPREAIPGGLTDPAVGANTEGAGPWIADATNIREGGAVAQSTSGSCVSACGEMLTGGSVSESELLGRLGEWSNPQALAGDLNSRAGATEWRGGWFASGEQAVAVAQRGPMGATLQMPGVPSHMVVIEPEEGAGFLVRDPSFGGTYEVTRDWIERYVSGGVFRL